MAQSLGDIPGKYETPRHGSWIGEDRPTKLNVTSFWGGDDGMGIQLSVDNTQGYITLTRERVEALVDMLEEWMAGLEWDMYMDRIRDRVRAVVTEVDHQVLRQRGEGMMGKAKKYRKKPVVIEAVKFTGENWRDVETFVPVGKYNDDGTFQIVTLEGEHKCSIGDYVIKGVKGEFYPCKPDIFEQTYEKA